MEDNAVAPKKIDILQAIWITVLAWQMDVKPKTIQNCFIHCGIKTHVQGVVTMQNDSMLDHKVVENLQSQIQHFSYSDPMQIRDFLDYPGETLATFRLMKQFLSTICSLFSPTLYIMSKYLS